MKSENEDAKREACEAAIARREKFSELIRRIAAKAETDEEFQEFGVIVIEETKVYERKYRVREADIGGYASAVHQHARAHAMEIAQAANPWGYFLLLVRNKVVELQRRVWADERRTIHLAPADPDDDRDPLEDSIFAKDGSLDPSLSAMLLDDWGQVERMLAGCNEKHAVFFRMVFADGFGKVEVAALMHCTQNAVQLAVERVHEVVLKGLLGENRSLLERLVGRWNGRKTEPLWEWLNGGKWDLRWLAKQWRCPRKEALAVVCSLMRRVMEG